MLAIKDTLVSYKVAEPKLKIVNGHQAVIQELCDFMGDPKEKWSYWNGRTRRLKDSAIRDLMREASTGKNPHSFFNWLLKKEIQALR